MTAPTMQLLVSFKSFSKYAAGITLLAGCLVVLGWLFDIPAIKDILPGLATMKANTALMFIFSGAALWMLNSEQVPDRTRRLAQVCALIVTLTGFLTLTEYFLAVDLGIDQLLFRDADTPAELFPGRMSIITAIGFLFSGLSLLLLDNPRSHWLSAGPALATLTIAVIALIGYIFGEESLYKVGLLSSMALHTTVMFLLLCLGILFARAEREPMRTFASEDAGGVIARRFIPILIVFIVIADRLILLGKQRAFYDDVFGDALSAVCIILFVIVFTWRNSYLLSAADWERRQAEARYAALYENAPDMFVSVDAATATIIQCNAALALATGYAKEEIIGRSVLELYHPDCLNDVKKTFQLFRMTGAVSNVELQLKRKDGTKIAVILNASAVRDEQGGILQSRSTLRDITERKQAEEALRDIQDRMRGIVESAMDAIISVNTKQQIALVNSAAEQMFGYRADEMMGKPLGMLLPERFRDLHARQVGQFGATGLTRRSMSGLGTIHGLRANGEEFPAEASISQISVGADKMYTVILRDITTRKQAEEEREKLIAELTAKNAELERFTYTVSHDLKSPLVTMTAFLGYLEQDAMTGNLERFKGDTKRIANAVEKMSQLLNDLLELSRIGRFVNPPEIVPFEELARAAIGLVEGRIQECRAAIELQPDLPEVYGDRNRLTEVLQNLLDNAAKNMGDQPSPRIAIGRCGEEDGKPLFYVKDNGIGIAPEYRERVFGLFNKLDAASEGTGIGLALVRRIIEFHGGRIWVESAMGKGSAFCFTLPTQPKPDSVI